jgi:butyrate kinase
MGREEDVKILAINPGSTSTKVALYDRDKELVRKSLAHSSEELSHYPSIVDQLDFRKATILEFLLEAGLDSPRLLDAAVGRGGLLRPVSGGVYAVNELMKQDLCSGRYGNHASNLGALIADQVARDGDIPAFVVDPVVVDELEPLARYSGLPEIPRRSLFHALNQKSTARKAAHELGKPYPECNLIVAHMGGGTTVGVHRKGRVVDVNNGLDGDGPFSIERAGTLPPGDWLRYILQHSDDSVGLMHKLTGQGGVVAYLGTNDARRIESAIQAGLDGRPVPEGFDSARCLEVIQALSYQIAKEICSLGAVVCGEVDAIVLTGGIAHYERVVEDIRRRVAYLAPVLVYPGENELQALAEAVVEVLEGREQVQEYRG